MKQLNLWEARSLRRALRPAAGLAISALLAAFGCSTADAGDGPGSILPNGHLRSTARVSTSEKIQPLRSLDPLGAAVATSAASLPANNYRINRSLPPGGIANLGRSNPAAGPAGGSQVVANSSLSSVREVTVNSSIANPYGAEGIVNGGDGSLLTGGFTSGAIVAPEVTAVGTTGSTGLVEPGMAIGVATVPGTMTSSTGAATLTGGTASRTVVPRTVVTGFTSSSTTSATQPRTSGRSRFRIVNFFRRGSTSVTVQPTP